MLRVLLMEQGGYRFVGEMNGGHPVTRMEHLTCFVPGMLALGVMTGATTDAAMAEAHLSAAKELTYTCVQMYFTSPVGLAGAKQIGRAVQQECRDRSRMPSSA
eukprot:TRINITY_DN32083_c0_g1_i1.p1 TRINITY_DN32083_c0_g1~~TRINITY_DN32083_c0_g1_i1.p1  ORF type:complete len:117 (-),score=17.63 TRINITY_DN32083_c0_g1_i1:11-319(-)